MHTAGNAKKSRYRPEIDGLRAFAVIAVIINHFNKDLLPGGYLGVDIFFVISGYVITSSLASRQSDNFWDFLSGFYERRIKRIVPALVACVLISSALICCFNPNPGTYLQTGISSLIGFSNIFLFNQSTNYFAQSTELNPFTQTWSLGVEEQFYLLFPFLIWFTGFGKQTAKGARNLFFWIGTLTITSLTSFIFLHHVNQPAAYFLMPPRFWEMASGCLLFTAFHRQTSSTELLKRVPPLLIVAAMIAIMQLPISAAVPATFGIVILTTILIASLRQGTAAYNFFTLNKVVYIGLISYSLYLWHWPILSISRWTIGIHWWSAPIQVGLMLFMAVGSYKLVERPTRNLKTSRKTTIIIGLTSIFTASFTILGINGLRREIFLGGKSTYDDNREYRSLSLEGSTDRRLIVLGDSHAGAIGALLEDLNSDQNISIELHSRGAGIANIDPNDPKEFKVKAINAYANTLNKNDSILLVTNYQFVEESEVPDLSDEEQVIKLAEDKDASVILFRPIPYFDGLTSYRECYKAWYRPFADNNLNCSIKVGREVFDKQFKRIREEQDSLASRYPKTVAIFDAFGALCPIQQQECSSSDDLGQLYKDDDHLSAYGARKMRTSLTALLTRLEANGDP